MAGHVGGMLPIEDQVLLQDTLVSLSVEDTVIEQIMSMLEDQEVQIAKDPLPEIQAGWFGGSHTGGYRLATNATQASVFVEHEIKSMLSGLQQYRQAVKEFAADMSDTDEVIAVSNVRIQTADHGAARSIARFQSAADCIDGNAATTCAPPTENS